MEILHHYDIVVHIRAFGVRGAIIQVKVHLGAYTIQFQPILSSTPWNYESQNGNELIVSSSAEG